MFRGVESSGGVAAQGSIDLTFGSGLYLGTWGSNTFNGASEVDLYGGRARTFENGLGLDLGIIGYFFPEDSERKTEGGSFDYVEYYVGGSVGPFSATVYYTNDYFNTSDDAYYLTGKYTFNINDTVSIAAQLGYSDGDGVEEYFGGDDDSYTDYSLTLTKKLKEFGISFAFVNSDIDEDFGRASDDAPKFVLTLSSDFTI